MVGCFGGVGVSGGWLFWRGGMRVSGGGCFVNTIVFVGGENVCWSGSRKHSQNICEKITLS